MKYQVVLNFELTEQFMTLVPEHREIVSDLIDEGVLESYAVSMESQRVWMIFNATSKKQVLTHIRRSPLYNFFKIEVEEIFVYDGMLMRLPELSLN